ncbi:hypothetical protein E3N88_26229 [Mikania micrantha]|uniref:Uncharacterized protein n=1 Tax=Mikania micrantha TaxID=192012 RepID=A0A5N6N8N8_9ASTR|nr:hypothetical protein E3N88_26229 [Mikania micrantha]
MKVNAPSPTCNGILCQDKNCSLQAVGSAAVESGWRGRGSWSIGEARSAQRNGSSIRSANRQLEQLETKREIEKDGKQAATRKNSRARENF